MAGCGRRRLFEDARSPRRSTLWLLCALVLSALAGCASTADWRYATVATYQPVRPARYAGLPLESGQLVVSEAPSALNLIIALLPEHYQPYVHAGILSFEAGEPYVYEAIGSWGMLRGGRPTDAIRGAIERVSLGDFLRKNDFVAFYDPPPQVDRTRMIAFAGQHHRARTPFDAYFDASDRSRLYCAEFVAAALEHSGADPVPLARMRANRSLRVLLAWLGIDAERHYQAADLLRGAVPIGALSLRYTLTQARIHFAVRREIHRRFTQDQRLGHVVQRNGWGLRPRPQLRRFEAAAQRLLAAPGAVPNQARADAAVRQLAERMFGPLPTQACAATPSC